MLIEVSGGIAEKNIVEYTKMRGAKDCEVKGRKLDINPYQAL